MSQPSGRIDFLPSTIRSLERQTYEDFEVLVLDNACPPAAEAELTAWAARDPRVRVMSTSAAPDGRELQPRDRGGVRRLPTYCHDDDCLRPTFLERHVAFMDAHPSVGFSGSNYDFIDERGDVFDRVRVFREDGVWPGRDYILTLMKSEYNPLIMQSVFFRALPAKQNPFDEAAPPHYLDYALLMRISETSDVGYLAEPLVEVRRHSTQASMLLDTSVSLTLRARVLSEYCDGYASRWPSDVHALSAMHAGLRAMHRKACLRAWFEAGSPDVADRCLAELADTPLDRALGFALQGLEQLGMVTARRQRVARAIYRVKRTIRAATAR